MAIRNNLLGGNDIQENEVEFKSADYNDTNNELVRHNVNNYRANALNLIRQLEDRSVIFDVLGGEWAEAYTTAGGRLSSVNTTNTNALFDTNKYYPVTFDSTSYVIIEATDLSVPSFQINNCDIRQFETNKWLLYCTTGTDEEQRAQIYKTLFIGTGSVPTTSFSISGAINSITGLTSLKTSIAADVGKRAYAFLSYANPRNGDGATTATTNITFDSTTGNDNVNIWSFCSGRRSGGSSETSGEAKLNGTQINYQASPSDDGVTYYSDHLGDDRTVDDTNNPTSASFIAKGGNTYDLTDRTYGNAAGFILTTETLSWTTEVVGPGTTSFSGIDYTTTGTPLFSAATEDVSGVMADSTIEHNIPSGSFSSSVNSCIGVPKVVDYENESDIQYKLTNAAEDSGWLNTNKIESFTAFTSEPTKCIVRLIPRTTNPTPNYPSISGFCVYGDKQ